MTRNYKNSRHTPARSCCSCRKKGLPQQFLRVTYITGEGLHLDNAVKRPGRGAYMCPRRQCIEQALKKGSLTRSLRAQLTGSQADCFLQQCLNRLRENADAENQP